MVAGFSFADLPEADKASAVFCRASQRPTNDVSSELNTATWDMNRRADGVTADGWFHAGDGPTPPRHVCETVRPLPQRALYTRATSRWRSFARRVAQAMVTDQHASWRRRPG